MELFNITRLKGENGFDTGKSGDHENDILQKLLHKIQSKEKTLLNRPEPSSKSDPDDNEVEEGQNEEVAQSSCEQEVQDNGESSKDDLGGFQILEDHSKKVTVAKQIAIILPPWLAHPVLIPCRIDLRNESEELSSSQPFIKDITYLHHSIRKALQRMNITQLFPVQSTVIPYILTMHSKPLPFRARDICVSAPTGSGKTLAFAIPIVQLLLQRRDRAIRALIVLPVTELAAQVYRVFKELTENTDINVLLLSTQTPFHLEQKKLVECYKNEYYSKIDILITTPGRLVEHIHSTKGLSLKSLKFLVIDEADRIMDEVFQNWLYHVYSHVRATSNHLLAAQNIPLSWNELEMNYNVQPHKLLFSATLSADPEKLQSLGLFRPKLFASSNTDLNQLYQQSDDIRNKQMEYSDTAMKVTLANDDTVGKYVTPSQLTEKYCLTESRVKPLTLFTLIKDNNWPKFLCFTNSVSSSARLTFVLKELCQRKITVAELSTNQNAKQRARILTLFCRGKIKGIICSDALARGIDIPNIDVVISYDPPRHIRTYIHRIGRTARAGRPGTAITLLNTQEKVTFMKMLAEVGKTIENEIEVSPDKEGQYVNIYSKALQKLRDNLLKEKRYKILVKERIASQPKFVATHLQSEMSTSGAIPKQLTLMEKLQEQAAAKIQESLVEQSAKSLLISKKKPSKKYKPRKKMKDQ